MTDFRGRRWTFRKFREKLSRLPSQQGRRRVARPPEESYPPIQALQDYASQEYVEGIGQTENANPQLQATSFREKASRSLLTTPDFCSYCQAIPSALFPTNPRIIDKPSYRHHSSTDALQASASRGCPLCYLLITALLSCPPPATKSLSDEALYLHGYFTNEGTQGSQEPKQGTLRVGGENGSMVAYLNFNEEADGQHQPSSCKSVDGKLTLVR